MFTSMTRFLLFIFVVIFYGSGTLGDPVSLREYDVVHVVDNHNTCSRHETRLWVNIFTSCFVNRKYHSGINSFNIVNRLLDRTKTCMKSASRECRPSSDGFVHIMSKAIELIRGYAIMHVERLINAGIIAERHKITDLNCVENGLSKDTYVTCFSSVISTYEELLSENETYDLIFQKEVEKAIICTNAANKECGKPVKIDLNEVVRYILGVKHPEAEDVQNEPISSELSSSTELLPTGFRKTGQENIDNNFETSKVPDIISHPHTTELPITEKESVEVIFKIKKKSKSLDFSEEKNTESKLKNSDLRSHEIESTTFTESTSTEQTTLAELNNSDLHSDEIASTVFSGFKTFSDQHSTSFTDAISTNEPIIFTDVPKPEKESIRNDTKPPADPEITQTPLPSEFSKSTEFPESVGLFKSSASFDTNRKDNAPLVKELSQFFETTQSPTQFFSNSSTLEDSKDIVASENGKDMVIDLSGWEEKFTTFAESPQLLTTKPSKLKDLQSSTKFSVSKSKIVASTDKVIMVDTSHEEITTEPDTSHEETTSNPLFTDLPKQDDNHRLMITELSKPENIQNITGLVTSKEHVVEELGDGIVMDPVTSTLEAKTIASTKLPISNDTLMSTATIVARKPINCSGSTSCTKLLILTDVLNSTAFTKLPMSTNLPKSTMSTKSPKPIDLPRSTASTMRPKPMDLPKSTTSTKRPKPTPITRFISSTRRTTTTRIRWRARNTTPRYEPPRPTEVPWRWYDYIVQPIVSAWRTIKSWFGF